MQPFFNFQIKFLQIKKRPSGRFCFAFFQENTTCTSTIYSSVPPAMLIRLLRFHR